MTGALKMIGIFSLLALLTPVFAQEAADAVAAVAEAATEVAEAAAEEAPAYADYDAFAASPGFALFTVNNLWLLISAALVFIMHLGFSTVESGLCQSKNTVNILFKNVFIVCIGLLGYAFYGFNAMYPGVYFDADAGTISKEVWNGFFTMGSGWFAVDNNDVSMVTDAYNNYTWWTDFIFQGMFAATAATIVSGAVAERIKLGSFMVYAALLVTFIYPITGSWQWGTGWLASKGFYDFAGSSLVHGFGGFAALAAVIVLGPRLGKYKDGKIIPILGHSMPLATIGVFLLWLGWFGFNGGSVLSADPRGVSYVFVTTALAAAAGGLFSICTSWMLLKKPDLSMALNGILAGLVGITAGADSISMHGSIIVGAIAGIIVVFSIIFFDKVKIDDPVGAISVHGVCGIWGTLAVALFSDAATFGTQLLGTASVCAFAFVASLILSLIIKAIMGWRVSAEEETEGLDAGEHGAEAYPDFTAAHK